MVHFKQYIVLQKNFVTSKKELTQGNKIIVHHTSLSLW